MKTKDLLSHLSDLEIQLNNFSFEELTAKEASKLKRSFNSFKIQLEGKIASKRISYSTDGIKEKYPQYSEENTKRKHTTAPNDGLLLLNACQKLNAPLQHIIGLTNSLEEATGKNKNVYREQLRHTTNEMMDLVAELLEYSRLSVGMEPFAKVTFDLRAVVKETIFLCNTLMLKKELKVHTSIDPCIPEMVKGDPSKLVQVLMNLLENMIQFGTKPEINLRISSSGESEGVHYLVFELSEIGYFAGMTHDIKTRFGGLSIGIAQKILEYQSGALAMYSGNNGPTFQFSLPFPKGSAPKKIRSKYAIPVTDGQLKVMVLENRSALEKPNSWGRMSYVTDNAQKALSLCEFFTFDLIVIDLVDPPVNWESMVLGIRNSRNEELRSTQILAFATPSMEPLAKDHGINGSIVLPLSHGELVDKLSILKKHIKMTEKMESSNRKLNGLSSGENLELDLKAVLEECMGDIVLLEELIVLYKSNVLEFIGNIKYHMALEDFEQIQFAAHKMKAGLAMMKTFGLHEIVVRIHHSCKTDKDIKYITFLYNCFLEEYPLVEAAIEDAVKKIKK